MDVTGRKAVVIGGTSGIGLATTRSLLDKGAAVVAVSRNPDRAGSIDGNVEFRACDSLNREAMAALFAEIGPFDMLVNAATGGERAMGPFLSMDLDGYRHSFDKLWGYANSIRLGCDYLSDDGAVVLVSGSPARRAKPGQAALASVGGAVEAFVRTLAPELAPRRINVVSPGLIATPMMGEDSPQRRDFLSKVSAKHLIPRPGTAEEVASAILFLLENDFVTGTTIDVDGGWLLSI